MEKKYITEEDGEQDVWYKEATAITLETLPDFLKKLTENYSHDMNTVCHAFTAGALATIAAMNKTPEGGLGAAQSQKIMTLFVRNWSRMVGPAKIIAWFGVLNPINELLFNGIPKSVMNLLVAEAKKFIEDIAEEEKKGIAHDPSLKLHLKNIASGQVPFGLKLDERF